MDFRAPSAYVQRMRLGMLGALVSVCLHAQGNFASIEGRIEDASHRPVFGVRIEVRSKGTGATRMTQTNESGLFEVPSLQPAEYLVDVTAENFSPVRREIKVE